MNKFLIFLSFLLATIINFNPCYAQAPDWLWAKTATGKYCRCIPSAIVTDSLGNCYVAGDFNYKSVTFGTQTVFSQDSSSTNYVAGDVFLVKYDANGNVVWAKSAGGLYSDQIKSMSIDEYGYIYITGTYDAPGISFGTVLLTSTKTILFIAKYDKDGNLIWAKTVDGNFYVTNKISLKTDSNGYFYLTGVFGGNSIKFGSIILTNANSENNIFLAKYNLDGNVIWAKIAGGTSWDNSCGVGVDSIGNIYLSGTFQSDSLEIGNYTLLNKNINREMYNKEVLFIAKYNANGEVLWAKLAAGKTYGSIQSMAVDKSGNIFIVGNIEGDTATFIPNTPITSTSGDAFIAKYNSNGNIEWVYTNGNNPYDSQIINSVDVDDIGNAYVTGAFVGVLVKYDTYGNLLWKKNADSGEFFGGEIFIDLSGYIYLGGEFENSGVTLGATTLPDNSSCHYNYLISKLSNYSAIAKHTDLSCYESNDGTATASARGGTAPYSYAWNTVPQQTTQTITGLSAGMYTVTTTDANGLISVANIKISQPPIIMTTLNKVICKGNSLTFNGSTYTKTGTYYDTLSSAKGCDSIIKLSVTIDPLDTTKLSRTICKGSGYNFFGTNLTAAGTYYHRLQSSYGCDSVISVTISINPVFTTKTNKTICGGESYNFNAHVYTTSGIYNDTLQTVSGCDSIIITNLIVNPSYKLNNSQTICNGESYTFNGHTYSATGIYYDTLLTTHGCDSIIITHLTVNPVYFSAINKTICKGNSFIFKGNTISKAGIYYDSLKTNNGCDSVIKLSLFVAPIDTSIYSKAICMGENYVFFGTQLTDAGTYNHTVTSSFGCDSIIKLKLKINPLPIVKACDDVDIFAGSEVQLKATGGITYEWQPTDYLNNQFISNPIATPPFSISYIVTAKDANGCAASDTVAITVEESSLWLPNVFNPNNSEPINQKFYARGKGIKDFVLVIYDRWGEKVFETNDVSQGWDGTFNGVPLPSAVFDYYVKATFLNEKKIEKKGDFTLLR